MSLFGRRKPGFVKYEPDDAAELTEESKASAEQSAGAVEESAPAEQTEQAPELFELLESLPDVEDPYEQTKEPEPQEEQQEEELTDAQKLAQYLRTRSAGAALTPYLALKAEIEQTDELLEAMKGDPKCADIVSVQGAKDRYFYSNENMTDNYAMIISLVEEKNYPYTIAKMVRWNCETYPAATPYTYFERHPYYMTRPQLERALDVVFHSEEYSDIHQVINNENTPFLYSTRYMTEKYVRGLVYHEEFTD